MIGRNRTIGGGAPGAIDPDSAKRRRLVGFAIRSIRTDRVLQLASSIAHTDSPLPE